MPGTHGGGGGGTRDAGLDALIARHDTPIATSQEQFYGIVNEEGRCEYGPSFQVVQSVYGDLASYTYLGRLKYDSQSWAKQGGCYGVQLLDGLFQVPLILPSSDPQLVAYAGGFEVRGVVVVVVVVVVVILLLVNGNGNSTTESHGIAAPSTITTTAPTLIITT